MGVNYGRDALSPDIRDASAALFGPMDLLTVLLGAAAPIVGAVAALMVGQWADRRNR